MLEDKILSDYKEALKDKDTLRSSALSFLRSQLKYAAIDKRKEKLEDNDCIAVIKKQIKQREDSIEQFKKGNRLDLADKEVKELEILKSYLPAQLSEEEIKKVIEETVSAMGAVGLKDMGRVMKEVMAKVGQSAGNKLTSELVKKKLMPG